MSLIIPKAEEMKERGSRRRIEKIERCAAQIFAFIEQEEESCNTLAYIGSLKSDWPYEIFEAALALFVEKGYVIEESDDGSEISISWG